VRVPHRGAPREEESVPGADVHAVDDDLLTLQEAAEALKVHYMTAYRWVRRGDLPAFKAGGRLRVRVADVEQFVTSRQVDVALPAEEPGRTDWTLHRDRLLEVLLAGDGVEAASLVRRVVADGAPAGDVYLNLLTPTLHRVGEAWRAGEANVAVEHRATEICSGIVARLGEHFRRRGPARGVAVTLTLPGEQHALAAAMVADFLRGWGYGVHHLGPCVPLADLRQLLQTAPTDVICVSVTVTDPGEDAYRAVVTAAHDAGAHVVVVGGQAADRAAVEAAGAVYHAELRDLGDRLKALAAG
jgi:MerR family transcriptional regulator, light-induced transcriptional regulator